MKNRSPYSSKYFSTWVTSEALQFNFFAHRLWSVLPLHWLFFFLLFVDSWWNIMFFSGESYLPHGFKVEMFLICFFLCALIVLVSAFSTATCYKYFLKVIVDFMIWLMLNSVVILLVAILQDIPVHISVCTRLYLLEWGYWWLVFPVSFNHGHCMCPL